MEQNTFYFSAEQKKQALIWLVFWHILIVLSSNYLVQIPFIFFGLKTTWGAFTFPFIFLTTDLTVRIFGATLARKIIFCAMIPALIISYVVGVLFVDAHFVGFSPLHHFNSFVGRIALASFVGYLVGQILDIVVFSRLRQLKAWWVAPATSTLFGNAIDSIIFFSVAFYKSTDAFMAENWLEFGLVDFGWKLVICTLFFLPAYGVLLKTLTRLLTVKTCYNPCHANACE